MVLEAVTFDFWDTLVAMDGSSVTMRDRQIDGFAEALLRHGHTRERDELVEVFAENWTRFEAQWEANAGQYTPADATDFIVERLGVPVTPAMRADLIDAFRIVGERADLEPAPGIEECLSDPAWSRGQAGHRVRRRADPFAHAARPPHGVRPAAMVRRMVVQR